jgi:triosephosphate isomerase
MTVKYIVANWKMNGSKDLVEGYKSLFPKLKEEISLIVCPPFVFLDHAKTKFENSPFKVGAQDCHPEPQGAFTGNISASMLSEVGCTFAILGHSERRSFHGETSALVFQKAKACQDQGIIPIICVGETQDERAMGETLKVLESQISQSCPKEGTYLVAYEPLWAIGSGLTPTDEDIVKVIAFIHGLVGEQTPVLYGGSVNGANGASILNLPGVNGILVGGASLKVDEMNKILEDV